MRNAIRGVLGAGRTAAKVLKKLPKRLVRSFLLIALASALVFCGYHISRAGRMGAGPGLAIRQVEAKVDVGETSAKVRLTFDVAGPGLMREVRVPILPGGVTLVEATLDGSEAELDLVDDRPALIVRGGGRRNVDIVYAIPLPEERRLCLALPRGIRTSVELGLAAPGMTVKAASPAIVEMLPAESGTKARIITPPTETLTLSWFPKPEDVEIPVRTAARTETLYTMQGDSLCGRSVYSLRVEGEDVSRFAFDLADGVAVDQLEGSWVDGWDVSGGKLLVQSKEAVTGETVMTIHHRRPLPDGEVALEVPVLEGAVRQWGFGAVAAGGAVELKELVLGNASQIDPRGLPSSLRSAGAATIARAFRYDGVPSTQRLALVRHKETETLEATADSLNGLLVYTSDGRAVGKMVYWVRNVRRQHLAVLLPAGAELWSVYVARNPVRPSGTDDGKLLIPLSCSAATANKAFPVEVVYFVPGAAFADKGKFGAKLPEVDIPVMQVMLSVSLPEEITLEDAGGNLKQVDSFAMSLSPQDIQLVRDAQKARPNDAAVQEANDKLDATLARGWNGQVRLRFDYVDLADNTYFQKALRPNQDNRNFVQQYYLENYGNADKPDQPVLTLSLTGFGQAELAEITGLASLKVAVPAGGNVLRFERQLLLKEAATVAADYWSALAARPEGDGELRLDSEVAALFRLSRQGVKLTARLDYLLDSGKVDTLAYELPAGAKVLSVRGTNLARWEVERGTLEVRLVRPERKGGSFVIEAEIDEVDITDLKLVPPELSGTRSQKLLVGLDAPPEYELRFEEATELEQVLPGTIPEALWGPARSSTGGQRTARAAITPGSSGQPVWFRLGRGRRHLGVRTTIHKELAGLEATCDSVNAISFYTEDGVCVTRAIFEIRNVGERHLELALPKGAKLWGAFVADRAVRLLAGTDGKTLIPLDRSIGSRVRSFPVEVVYMIAGSPFERRGSFEADLPKVSIPIMHVMYSAYLPKKLRLGRFGGTLRHVREFSAPVAPARISMGRLPAREARPTYGPNAIYQRRQMALEMNFSERDVAKALGPATAARKDPSSTSVAGALKIYIPAVGQIFRFERHLVVKGGMTVACNYRG